MKKELLEKLINLSLTSDIDFSEIFYEKTNSRSINIIDNKLDKVNEEYLEGVGIRLSKKDNTVYGYSNELSEAKLIKLVNTLKKNFKNRDNVSKVLLIEEGRHTNNYKIDNKSVKEKLMEFNAYARKRSNLISQVIIRYYNKCQNVTIAKNENKLVYDTRFLCRISFSIVVEQNGKTAQSDFNLGNNNYYDFLDNEDIYNKIDDCVNNAIRNLSAKSVKGGKMPVILAPGFGAVIFHEACGHSMEATSVAKKISVLTGKLGEKIASEKVTIVDDGTLDNKWGTTVYDDEGQKTQRNVLIKNGVLVNYLVDILNSKKMNCKSNGCGRRESYAFSVTSRMNNTFLEPGTDKIEDMIKSIDYGIYASSMGGGSVDPITGDFNFNVKEAYLIENGKVTIPLKSISLIGNTLEILNNVEMVSDDFALEAGLCGSESGNVPVTIGQPTIKISSILVGGTNE